MSFTFGIEIEMVVETPSLILNESNQAAFREALASALRARGLPAIAKRNGDSYRAQQPEHYNKWNITTDGSLVVHGPYERMWSSIAFPIKSGIIRKMVLLRWCEPIHWYFCWLQSYTTKRWRVVVWHYPVALEAVSPIMEISHTSVQTRWSFLHHVDKFWNAVDATFLKVTKNTSCGAHVHVAAEGRRYTFEELKAVAFAVAAQEDFIRGILPPERIDNDFARPSSVHSDDLREDLERGLQLGPQETLKELGRTISRMRSPQELYVYMQGHDQRRQRYALWNFKNTVGASACGTVEFRGGRHLRGKVRTKRWIAFAVAFVSMAITNKVSAPMRETGETAW